MNYIDQVDKLIQQVSEENGLAVSAGLGAAGTSKLEQKAPVQTDVNDLDARLNALKQ